MCRNHVRPRIQKLAEKNPVTFGSVIVRLSKRNSDGKSKRKSLRWFYSLILRDPNVTCKVCQFVTSNQVSDQNFNIFYAFISLKHQFQSTHLWFCSKLRKHSLALNSSLEIFHQAIENEVVKQKHQNLWQDMTIDTRPPSGAKKSPTLASTSCFSTLLWISVKWLYWNLGSHVMRNIIERFNSQSAALSSAENSKLERYMNNANAITNDSPFEQ